MNLLLLYLLLLKETATSLSGLTSMPVVRNDMVERYHVLTDRQLNAAVAAGRPGTAGGRPVGASASWPWSTGSSTSSGRR